MSKGLDNQTYQEQKNYLYQLEIDGYIIHENYISYSKVNIREEQKVACEKLEMICKEIDEYEESGINIDKWFDLETILMKLGINFSRDN